MYVDAQNLFSDAQTVTTGSENGVKSTNVIDLGVARNIGVGERLWVVVQVDTALTGAGDTCTAAIITDDNADMSSATVVQTIGTFAANSAAGTRLIAAVQPSESWERYIAIRYTAAGSGPLETGAFTAFLTNNIDAYKSYPDAFTIS